jgi:hypothetical protein
MASDTNTSRPTMPLRYAVGWGIATALLLGYQQLHATGWPPGNYLTLIATVVIGGLLGGYSWGWIFWRLFGARKADR